MSHFIYTAVYRRLPIKLLGSPCTLDKPLTLPKKTFSVLHKNFDKKLSDSVCIKRCRHVHDWPESMTAWQIHGYGGTDKLILTKSKKVQPIVKPTDVLVEIHAASVNPIDVMMLGGYGATTLNPMRKAFGNYEFPLTLGRDFSGTVVGCGKGVPRSHFNIGDEVYGAIGAQRQGTHANYCIVGANEIAKKPKSLTHTEASSIPYVATTTWAALCTVGRLHEGSCKNKRLLITGGSGGIGTFAIQLLKAWGAEVTTTCSDATELLLNLGADYVLDYREESFESNLQELAGFNFIFNAVKQDSMEGLMALLERNSSSKCVSIVTPLLKNNDSLGLPLGLAKSIFELGMSNIKAVQEGKECRWAVFLPNGQALHRIAQLIDNGRIKPVIEKVYTFDNLPLALDHVAQKHGRGKTVIEVKV